MDRKVLFEIESLYRDNFRVTGLTFGKGEKSLCIVGNTRGNEYQQVFICSQLVKKLKDLESRGRICRGHEIMVVPSANPYSMNIEKRFWPTDNTDINRMFPGYNLGETTQRIAAGVFEAIKDYKYGIQFASFYMPGDFTPHVRIMKTELDYVDKAKSFGLPYIVTRSPRPYDTTTLNYNWQIWDTKAFSLYTTSTDRINPESAARGVNSIMRFLKSLGIIKSHQHPGFASQIITDERILSLRAPEGGLFEPLVHVEQQVTEGTLLARILNPLDGEPAGHIFAPKDGIIFFLDSGPLTYAHTAVIKMITNL